MVKLLQDLFPRLLTAFLKRWMFFPVLDIDEHAHHFLKSWIADETAVRF